MFADLFYLIGFIFVWEEFQWIVNLREKLKITTEMKLEVKRAKNGGIINDKNRSTYFTYLIILIWLAIGLITVQWYFFMAFILFHLLIYSPITKLFDQTKLKPFLHWVSSLTGFLTGLFLILNHFHLHISFIPQIKQFLKL